MRYAIATGSIAAASGSTPASGTAVLSAKFNGVIQPIKAEFRPRESVGQRGEISLPRWGKGLPIRCLPPGPSYGGDEIGTRNSVWTIIPVGSIFGTRRPYHSSALTVIPASQIFPYYNFEDDGTDWSGRDLDLTVTSGSYSTTRVVGSKSANFQNACHFSHAHNEYFSGADGAGIRICFWIYPVALGSGGALDFQGIITKGSVNTSSGAAVFTGDWGIFYAQNGVAGTKDLHVAIKTSTTAIQILHSMAISTGAWYFIDVVINNYGSNSYGGEGIASVNVRGAATTNSGEIAISGNMLGDTSQLLRIGNNSEGDKLGADSARFYIDAVSFSNDFTSPTTDEMYNSGAAYATAYTGAEVNSYLPSAATSLVTGTFQSKGKNDVFSSVASTTGAARPAVKITKPTDASADVEVEVGTSTSKFVADFTADASMATVRQTSNPKAVEVTWKGRYANHPVDISESDNGVIISALEARASDCIFKVTSIGSGAPNTGRLDLSAGPQDIDKTPASGCLVRDKDYGEASNPRTAAKALGHNPGSAITVRNPTSSSYSSGDVIRVE